MLAFLLLFALPLFAADDKPPTTAQAIELARLWLDAQRAYEGVPAISAAIVHDQNVLWSGGVGQADPASGRAATISPASVSPRFEYWK